MIAITKVRIRRGFILPMRKRRKNGARFCYDLIGLSVANRQHEAVNATAN